jgi:hypothetical protein
MAEEINWDAMREAYVAGRMSLGALARAHGLTTYRVNKHSRAEGWVAMRREAKAARGRADETEGVREAAEKRSDTAIREAAVDGTAEDIEVALRVRKKLLLKLEGATDVIPIDATEMKIQENSKTVKLLKLRDLTAAYKDLIDDMSVADVGREQARVIVDV